MVETNMLRKLGLTALFALFVCLGMARTPAAAAEEVITLSKSLTESYVVGDGQKLTLDVSRYTLKNETGENTITVNEGGELTIKGSTGKIINDCADGCVLVNYGAVTIQGGAFARKEGTEEDGFVIENYGTMYITGGTFSNESSYAAVVANHENASMTISGGELSQSGGSVAVNESRDGFEITGDAVIRSELYVDAIRNFGEARITGGSVEGSVMSCGTGDYEAVVTISGGTFTADYIRAVSAAGGAKIVVEGEPVITMETGFGTFHMGEFGLLEPTDGENAVIAVSGGIFDQKVSQSYWSAHHRQVAREDGSYRFEPLTESTASAVVEAGDGRQYFHTLRHAVLAAEKGATVELKADTAEDLAIPAGRDIVLDIGCYTVTGCVTNGGRLIIQANDGGIFHSPYAIDNQSGGAVSMQGGSYGAVRTQGGAALTLGSEVSVNAADGPAILVELGENAQETSLAISENAHLTAPADCHLVEVNLPEGAKAEDFQTVIRQIPAVFLHTAVIDPGKAAACTASGWTEGSHCAVCGKVLTERRDIPPLGHTEAVREAAAPTCTKTGLTEGAYCPVCHVVLKEQSVIPALGHTEAVRAAVDPTCTEGGLSAGTYCSVCGVVMEEQTAVPPLGHVEVIDPAVPAACLEAGLTGGIHCAVCHAVLKAQEEVPAHGHAYGPWTETIPASCGKNGEMIRTCTWDASHTETRTVPATGLHEWDGGTVIRNSDGADGGRMVFYCTVCGVSRSEPLPEEPLVEESPAVPSEPVPVIPDPGVPEKPVLPPADTEAGIPAVPELPEEEQTPLASAIYQDITPSIWYDEAVGFVSSRGLMTGTSSGGFTPEGKMTRAMLWTVLGRMDGADVNGAGKDWYAKAQAWSIENGISDGSQADENITREQMVTMLWRFAKEPEAYVDLSRFSDSAQVSGWSGAAMQWAVSVGLVEGSGGRLNPGGEATRAEVAMILMRLVKGGVWQ